MCCTDAAGATLPHLLCLALLQDALVKNPNKDVNQEAVPAVDAR